MPIIQNFLGNTTMIKILSLLFLFILSTNNCKGQRLVEFKQVFSIEKNSATSGYIRTMIPKSEPKKQTLIGVNYSIQPDLIFKENNILFAEWNLRKMKYSDSIEITTVLLIERYDLHTAKKMPKSTNNDLGLGRYLKHESNFQKNNKKIQEQAKQLIGKDEEETISNIFNFVIEHLEYHNFVEEDRGAKKALKQQRGDCTEYSELMITLCRANNIPAKIVSGKTLSGNQEVGLHNWVEIYMDEYGWVPFDPTHADGENSLTQFSKMENKYVYLSNERDSYQTSWNFYNSAIIKTSRHWKDLLYPKFERAYTFYQNDENEDAKLVLDSLISITPLNYQLHMLQGMVHARLKDFDPALKHLQYATRAAYFEREKMDVIYSFANYFALKNELDLAITFLKQAIKLGFKNGSHLEKDQDLVHLRELKEFKDIVQSLKEVEN
ncbi:MAG: transglutaminase domain-containing protein [Chitinophagales bacterium]